MAFVNTRYANCCSGIKAGASSDSKSNVYLISVHMSVFGDPLVLLRANDKMRVKHILFVFILFHMRSV